MDKRDAPFNEVVKSAQGVVEMGGVIHQKFTCVECGARQTIETPNAFYVEGRCEECGAITNMQEQGCNFLALLVL